MVFQYNQCGTMLLQIESAQDLHFHAFGVDRKKIDLNCRGFCDDVVERRHLYFDLFRARDFAFHTTHVRPRISFGNVEDGPANLLRRAYGDLPDDAAFADFAEFFAATRQRLNQNPFPAALFQKPRLAQARRMIRADFHEKTVWLAIEIIPNDLVFMILGERFGGALLYRSGQSADTVKILANGVKVFYDHIA